MSRPRSFAFAVCVVWLGVMAAASAEAQVDGAEDEASRKRETWFAEAGVGLSGARQDAYVERLDDFGFEADDALLENVGVSTQTLGYMFRRNYGVLLRHEGLEHRRLARWDDHESARDTYRWDSRALTVGGRFRKPLMGEWFALYAQLDIGIGIARTRYRNIGDESHVEWETGLAIGGMAGVAANFFKHGGAYVEAGYMHARILENNFGDRHQDGGVTIIWGLRLRMLEKV